MIHVLFAVLLLVMGSVGYRSRLFQTATIFFRLAFSFIVAYVFAEPLARLLSRIAPSMGTEFWNFLAFFLLFAAVFLVLTYLTVVYIEADDVSVPPLLDRIGGVAMGLVSGCLLAGILLIAWAMAVPFSPVRFVVEEKDLKLDMGKIVLQEFGRLQKKIPGAQAFDTGKAIEGYRDADINAVEKKKRVGASGKKEETGEKSKGKGVSAEIEEDSSISSIKKKQLQESQK